MMFPLLELAGSHMRFISDVLYVYNEATPINDYKKNLIRQLHCEKVIRSKTKYQPASTYMVTKRTIDPIDMVLFSSDVQVVDTLLGRILPLCEQIDSLTIFYTEDEASSFASLVAIYDDIPGVAFLSEQNMRQFFDTMCNYAGYFLLAKEA